MAQSTGSAEHDRGTRLGDELESERELWWTGVQALLQANEAERRAIEEYLHLMRAGGDHPLDAREVDELIDAAIENHRRAVDDLQLAKESVAELRTDR